MAIAATLFLRVTTYCGAFLLPANSDLTGICRMARRVDLLLHLRLLSSIIFVSIT